MAMSRRASSRRREHPWLSCKEPHSVWRASLFNKQPALSTRRSKYGEKRSRGLFLHRKYPKPIRIFRAGSLQARANQYASKS